MKTDLNFFLESSTKLINKQTQVNKLQIQKEKGKMTRGGGL